MEEEIPVPKERYRHSEETRKKISERVSGKKKTAEHKANLSLSAKGKTKSEEHRRKISESIQRYWAEKRLEKQQQQLTTQKEHENANDD